MFKRLRSVFTLVVALLVTTQVAQAANVLRVGGNIVKWTPQTTGETTVITYALLQGRYAVPSNMHTLSPDNCGVMRPFADVVAVSTAVSQTAASQELRAAFAAWEMVAAVRFMEVSDLGRAKIIIGATDSSSGRAFANLSLGGKHGALPVAKALGGSGSDRVVQPGGRYSETAAASIEQAYICLNSKMRWKTGFDGNLNVYDLRHTFMHEIGHAIGLDHPGSSGSIMGFRYDERVRQLQPSDIDAAQWLYGPPETEPETE